MESGIPNNVATVTISGLDPTAQIAYTSALVLNGAYDPLTDIEFPNITTTTQSGVIFSLETILTTFGPNIFNLIFHQLYNIYRSHIFAPTYHTIPSATTPFFGVSAALSTRQLQGCFVLTTASSLTPYLTAHPSSLFSPPPHQGLKATRPSSFTSQNLNRPQAQNDLKLPPQPQAHPSNSLPNNPSSPSPFMQFFPTCVNRTEISIHPHNSTPFTSPSLSDTTTLYPFPSSSPFYSKYHNLEEIAPSRIHPLTTHHSSSPHNIPQNPTPKPAVVVAILDLAAITKPTKNALSDFVYSQVNTWYSGWPTSTSVELLHIHRLYNHIRQLQHSYRSSLNSHTQSMQTRGVDQFPSQSIHAQNIGNKGKPQARGFTANNQHNMSNTPTSTTNLATHPLPTAHQTQSSLGGVHIQPSQQLTGGYVPNQPAQSIALPTHPDVFNSPPPWCDMKVYTDPGPIYPSQHLNDSSMQQANAFSNPPSHLSPPTSPHLPHSTMFSANPQITIPPPNPNKPLPSHLLHPLTQEQLLSAYNITPVTRQSHHTLSTPSFTIALLYCPYYTPPHSPTPHSSSHPSPPPLPNHLAVSQYTHPAKTPIYKRLLPIVTISSGYATVSTSLFLHSFTSGTISTLFCPQTEPAQSTQSQKYPFLPTQQQLQQRIPPYPTTIQPNLGPLINPTSLPPNHNALTAHPNPPPQSLRLIPHTAHLNTTPMLNTLLNSDAAPFIHLYAIDTRVLPGSEGGLVLTPIHPNLASNHQNPYELYFPNHSYPQSNHSAQFAQFSNPSSNFTTSSNLSPIGLLLQPLWSVEGQRYVENGIGKLNERNHFSHLTSGFPFDHSADKFITNHAVYNACGNAPGHILTLQPRTNLYNQVPAQITFPPSPPSPPRAQTSNISTTRQHIVQSMTAAGRVTRLTRSLGSISTPTATPTPEQQSSADSRPQQSAHEHQHRRSRFPFKIVKNPRHIHITKPHLHSKLPKLQKRSNCPETAPDESNTQVNKKLTSKAETFCNPESPPQLHPNPALASMSPSNQSQPTSPSLPTPNFPFSGLHPFASDPPNHTSQSNPYIPLFSWNSTLPSFIGHLNLMISLPDCFNAFTFAFNTLVKSNAGLTGGSIGLTSQNATIKTNTNHTFSTQQDPQSSITFPPTSAQPTTILSTSVESNQHDLLHPKTGQTGPHWNPKEAQLNLLFSNLPQLIPHSLLGNNQKLMYHTYVATHHHSQISPQPSSMPTQSRPSSLSPTPPMSSSTQFASDSQHSAQVNSYHHHHTPNHSQSPPSLVRLNQVNASVARHVETRSPSPNPNTPQPSSQQDNLYLSTNARDQSPLNPRQTVITPQNPAPPTNLANNGPNQSFSISLPRAPKTPFYLRSPLSTQPSTYIWNIKCDTSWGTAIHLHNGYLLTCAHVLVPVQNYHELSKKYFTYEQSMQTPSPPNNSHSSSQASAQTSTNPPYAPLHTSNTIPYYPQSIVNFFIQHMHNNFSPPSPLSPKSPSPSPINPHHLKNVTTSLFHPVFASLPEPIYTANVHQPSGAQTFSPRLKKHAPIPSTSAKAQLRPAPPLPAPLSLPCEVIHANMSFSTPRNPFLTDSPLLHDEIDEIIEAAQADDLYDKSAIAELGLRYKQRLAPNHRNINKISNTTDNSAGNPSIIASSPPTSLLSSQDHEMYSFSPPNHLPIDFGILRLPKEYHQFPSFMDSIIEASPFNPDHFFNNVGHNPNHNNNVTQGSAGDDKIKQSSPHEDRVNPTPQSTRMNLNQYSQSNSTNQRNPVSPAPTTLRSSPNIFSEIDLNRLLVQLKQQHNLSLLFILFNYLLNPFSFQHHHHSHQPLPQPSLQYHIHPVTSAGFGLIFPSPSTLVSIHQGIISKPIFLPHPASRHTIHTSPTPLSHIHTDRHILPHIVDNTPLTTPNNNTITHSLANRTRDVGNHSIPANHRQCNNAQLPQSINHEPIHHRHPSIFSLFLNHIFTTQIPGLFNFPTSKTHFNSSSTAEPGLLPTHSRLPEPSSQPSSSHNDNGTSVDPDYANFYNPTRTMSIPSIFHTDTIVYQGASGGGLFLHLPPPSNLSSPLASNLSSSTHSPPSASNLSTPRQLLIGLLTCNTSYTTNISYLGRPTQVHPAAVHRSVLQNQSWHPSQPSQTRNIARKQSDGAQCRQQQVELPHPNQLLPNAHHFALPPAPSLESIQQLYTQNRSLLTHSSSDPFPSTTSRQLHPYQDHVQKQMDADDDYYNISYVGSPNIPHDSHFASHTPTHPTSNPFATATFTQASPNTSPFNVEDAQLHGGTHLATMVPFIQSAQTMSEMRKVLPKLHPFYQLPSIGANSSILGHSTDSNPVSEHPHRHDGDQTDINVLQLSLPTAPLINPGKLPEQPFNSADENGPKMDQQSEILAPTDLPEPTTQKKIQTTKKKTAPNGEEFSPHIHSTGLFPTLSTTRVVCETESESPTALQTAPQAQTGWLSWGWSGVSKWWNNESKSDTHSDWRKETGFPPTIQNNLKLKGPTNHYDSPKRSDLIQKSNIFPHLFRTNNLPLNPYHPPEHDAPNTPLNVNIGDKTQSNLPTFPKPPPTKPPPSHSTLVPDTSLSLSLHTLLPVFLFLFETPFPFFTSSGNIHPLMDLLFTHHPLFAMLFSSINNPNASLRHNEYPPLSTPLQSDHSRTNPTAFTLHPVNIELLNNTNDNNNNNKHHPNSNINNSVPNSHYLWLALLQLHDHFLTQAWQFKDDHPPSTNVNKPKDIDTKDGSQSNGVRKPHQVQLPSKSTSPPRVEPQPDLQNQLDTHQEQVHFSDYFPQTQFAQLIHPYSQPHTLQRTFRIYSTGFQMTTDDTIGGK